MAEHLLEVERNAEGSVLAILSPIEENGEAPCGLRVAGPKAWGGSINMARLKISDRDLERYVREYAPEVHERLKNG